MRFSSLSLLWKILLSTSVALTVLFGVTGWIVRAGDVTDLVRCLRIASDDGAVAAAGAAAYERWWLNPPTRARHVERLTSVYRAMLERDSNPASVQIGR